MRCDAVRERLDARADGELGRVALWRIDRHLSRCASCADELAAIRRLNAQTRTWRNVAAPGGLRARIAAFLAAAPALPDTGKERLAMQQRIQRRLSAAGVGLVVLLTMLAFLFFGPKAPRALAFADVQAAMRAVKTAHWFESATHFTPDGAVTYRQTMEVWARLDRPAIASRVRLDQSFSHDPDKPIEDCCYVTLENPVRHLAYNYTRGLYRHELGNQLAESEVEAPYLRQHIQRDLTASPDNLSASWQVNLQPQDHEYQQHPWSQEPDAVGRTRVVRFHCLLTGSRSQIAYTLWVHAGTRRILRREARVTDHLGRLVSLMTADRIECDTPLPPGVFDPPLPPGAQVAVRDYRWRNADISAQDQAKIERLLRRADEGIRQADFAQFASAWDFDYLSRLDDLKHNAAELRDVWEELVQQQQGRWRAWQTGVQAPFGSLRYVHLEKHGIGMLPQADPDILCATAVTRYTWAEDNDESAYGCRIYLRRRDGDFRIVWWQLPLRAIESDHRTKQAAGSGQ